MKVLLIDDDLVSLEIIKSFLDADMYEVCACSSAREAISKIEEDDFDLVITDIIMPEETGIDFIKDMWRHGVRPPVITMTAGPDNIENAQNDYVEFGGMFADESLAKPIAKDELLAVIERLTLPPRGGAKSGTA